MGEAKCSGRGYKQQAPGTLQFMSDGQGLRGRGIGEDRRRDIHRKGGRGHQVKSKTKTTEKGGLGKREESGKEDVPSS